jgi:hypothetical protein
VAWNATGSKRTGETESGARLCVEVVVLWRGDVLSVGHFALPATLFAGESPGDCDLLLPAEKLGAERFCIARAVRGQMYAVLPGHGLGRLTYPDGALQVFTGSSRAQQGAAPATQPPRLLRLDRGCRAHLCFEDIEIQVALVSAGRPPARRWPGAVDLRMLGYFAACSALVGVLLFLLALLGPPPGLNQGETAAADELRRVQEYLAASRQRARSETIGERRDGVSAGAGPYSAPVHETYGEEASSSAAAPLPTQPIPRADVLAAAARSSVENPERLEPTRTRRRAAVDEAVLHDATRTKDVVSGGLRTIAKGEGVWPDVIPHHIGLITGFRPGEIGVWGSLSQAAVRRTVSEHARSLRSCYEQGLAQDPRLAGRVLLRMLIQQDGSVQRVNTLGSDLASRSVLRCLEQVLYAVRFSQPESGTVMVTYPLELSP